MHRHQRKRRLETLIEDDGSEDVATIYNQAGADYIAYADGDPARLFSFDGLHAYSDRKLWNLLETKLFDLRAAGARSISILDAGCGPGTWLRRLVTRAKLLGFTEITARGFDVAETQIETARGLARGLSDQPGIDLTFEVAHLADRLPEADGSVDISLCLYSVLSHLPVVDLPKIALELARVTRGHLVTTVRSIGSTPTIFVGPMDKALGFKHDHLSDRCEIDLQDGGHFSVNFHLFSAAELRRIFAEGFRTEDLRGLDLFHTRFLPDPRWNPESLSANPGLTARLEQLEEAHARHPQFMERATHLLFVGRRYPATRAVRAMSSR